ncbi:MAG: DUF2799 domain-containing protein [Thioploca sp.]|nr:DUF2799 domain-containing protein [Thioploca sp.]
MMLINNKLTKLVAIVAIEAITCFSTGCATLSKEECLKGEWRVIGYKDGVKGYDMERLEKHEKACKDYSVKPDVTHYQAGRQAGLTYYCASSQGAAKLSEAESKTDQGDWLAIGFNNGKRGDRLGHMQDYIQDCKQYNIQLDSENYQLGWYKGIVQYCTPENGFEVGQSGEDYDGVCPPHLASAFLDQYLAGLDSKLSSIENDIDSMHLSIKDTINQLEETTDKEKRKSLRSTLDSHQSDYNKLIQKHRKIIRLYNRTQRMLMQLK